MSSIEEIADSLRNDKANIQLLYAFNSVGKTRLSMAYKDVTKSKDGKHTGVYYNAYSEDLFVWDNDIENRDSQILLTVRPSSLSKLHADINEQDVHAKLKPYRVSFDFRFMMHDEHNLEQGIKSISFFPAGTQPDSTPPIKISRGEERVFGWCFFLAMMELDGWADKQARHIFIDDPVTSLDDHNIFVTASTIYDLIEKHSRTRKIIIATHHAGMYSILCNWLKMFEEESEKKSKKIKYKRRILSGKHGDVSLETHRADVFLYHLRVLQVLKKARQNKEVRAYHFALLRQLLETVSSFLGVGRIGYALEQIGFTDADEISRIVHTLTHKNVYYYESDCLAPGSLDLFENIYKKLNKHYNFVTHTS